MNSIEHKLTFIGYCDSIKILNNNIILQDTQIQKKINGMKINRCLNLSNLNSSLVEINLFLVIEIESDNQFIVHRNEAYGLSFKEIKYLLNYIIPIKKYNVYDVDYSNIIIVSNIINDLKYYL